MSTAVLALVALIAQVMTLPSLEANESLQVKTLVRYLSRNSTQRSILLMGLIIGAHFASYTYIAPFMVQQAGFGATTITLTLLGFGLVGMLANFMVASSVTRHLQLSLGAVVVLMVLVLMSLPFLAGSPAGVIAAVLAWGVAYGAIPLALSTWMQLTSPKLPEASSAMLVTTFQVAIASGSLLGGMIVDGYGIAPALYFGAVLGVLGLLTMATFGLGHTRLIEKLQG